jgi:hypothetical protein
MKRIALLAILALALPLAAFGDSIDATNSGGTLAGSTAGMTLTGSELIAVKGFNGGGLTVGNLGSVTFSTGTMLGGTLQMGGNFNVGGSFVITTNGASGLPNGTLFTGSFTGPGSVTWTLVTLANGTHNYTLSGAVSGTWYNGVTVEGSTIQLTINTGRGFFNGTTTISSGDTNIVTSVPEPGTLGLLGTGLVGIAGAMHRKFKS